MYKLLIIEDDQIMGEMLAMYLTEEGYSVKIADHGQKGLELADRLHRMSSFST